MFANQDGNPLHRELLIKRFNRLVAFVGAPQGPAARPPSPAGVAAPRGRHGYRARLQDHGHSSIKLTADTYSHLLTGAGRRAAEAADALIPRGKRDQSVTSAGLSRPEQPL